MNQQVVVPKTVLEALLEWSADRPSWQRDAMRRIVAVGKLSETDISELVELCKVDLGADPSDSPRGLLNAPTCLPILGVVPQ